MKKGKNEKDKSFRTLVFHFLWAIIPHAQDMGTDRQRILCVILN